MLDSADLRKVMADRRDMFRVNIRKKYIEVQLKEKRIQLLHEVLNIN
jgi:hypothetical protein